MQKHRDNSFEAFRGIAIIAVVAIHAIFLVHGQGYSIIPEWNLYFLVGYQQLFNFAVPVFLFISGYWISNTPIESFEDYKAFLTKRLSRIVIPYLFWSVILLGYDAVKNQNIDAYSILMNLLTGRTSPPYYFILLIAQFYILTPVLQYINRKRYGMAIILGCNCISLLAIYLSKVYGVIGYVPAFRPFSSWLIFYQIGLWAANKNNPICLGSKTRCFIIPALLISILISQLEAGVLLLGNDHLSAAATQLKFSSFFYAACVIASFLCIKDRVKKWPTMLVTIGHYSFGIFLIHMMVLGGVFRMTQKINVIYSFQPAYQVMIVGATLLICCCLIGIARKIFGKSLCRNVLGF